MGGGAVRVLRGKRWIVLAAFVVGGAVGAGIASAVTTTTTVADTNTVRERIATISTDGNFNSGWHIHPGCSGWRLRSAQMETGRLLPDVCDRALAIIDDGGDVDRWPEDG